MGHTRQSERFAFARDPWWWAALVALVLNDHVLKHAGVLPGWLTGKLSDFVGLYVAPAVLVALLAGRAPRLAFVATGVVFAAINLSRGAADLLEAMLPWQIWTDPSDLVALPMLWLAWRRHVGAADAAPEGAARSSAVARAALRWRDRGALMLGALASVATSPIIEPGPRWIEGPRMGQLQVLGRYDSDIDAEVTTREVVRVRRLRDGVSVDCERLARDPRRVLTRGLFAPAERWSLGHSDALSFTARGECDVVWLEHDEAGAVLVPWSASQGARVTLRRQETAIGWVEEIGTDLIFRGDLRPPVPASTCAPLLPPPAFSAPLPSEHGLLWHFDARDSVDGCTELSFTELVYHFDDERAESALDLGEHVVTRYACGYPHELFEPFIGAAVRAVEEHHEGEPVLRLVEYHEEFAETWSVRRRLTLSGRHGFDFEAVPLADCAQVNGCGEIVRPWRLLAAGGGWAAVGDQAWTRDVLGRQERFFALGLIQGLAVDAACVDGAQRVGTHGVFALLEIFPEPTDPIDPEDPQPTDPTDPIDPADPEPVDPVDPDPTDPATEPTDPDDEETP
ncbi:MAG: hypothetical protein KF901_29775 [Myxococcales bacterium]|nr:hypothetical protein [Myxococcales bacterium]